MSGKILIIDDDATLQYMLVLQLNKLGYKPDSAFNGIEALRLVNHSRYELILMDLQMPEMDGYQVAAAIRAYEKAQGLEPMPILALSASPDHERCKQVEIHECFRKPLSMNELGSALKKYLPGQCGGRG